VTEEFKILSPRDHCRQRPGMYVGSTSVETVERFVMGQWKTVNYVPALSKMIDEIIDNSIDEAIRTEFAYANKIDVSILGDKVVVLDNGRGIPQDKVYDEVTKSEIFRPVAAWTRTNAGTSFSDNRVSIGAHGLGSALVNFMSKNFTGRTWQNGKLVEVHCTDGGLNIDVKVKKLSGNGTEVSFEPDFELLEANSLSDLDTVNLIEDRLTSLQMAFPEIKFTFNGRKVSASNMKAYSSMFVSNDNSSVLTTQTENVSFFFAASEDGFRSNSFVNGVNTRQGGSYVDFIVNSVVDELVSMVKRKHKIEVAKSTIKNGLTFVLFARKFTNPKFDSQTKERLTSTMGSVKQHYEESGSPDFTYLARKIMASNDIIDPIIEAQLAKKLAADKRSATLEQKKLKKVKVAKHIAANSDQATLFLVEGDSAASSFIEVRDPQKSGAYPLRGVVMNTWDLKPSEVLKNKELSELIAVLGLDINEPKSYDDMNYKKVAIMCDADQDGNHIATLLVAFFFKFWPYMVKEGLVSIVRSPIMISDNGKGDKWFYSYDDARDFKDNAKGYKHRYIKGLGSLQESEYRKIVNDPVLDVVSVDKPDMFEMMFGNNAEKRKEFMMQ
jgi:DNA gyrase/topoisomerase IV subunit B